MKNVLFFVMFVALVAGMIFAQETTGSVRAVVIDPDGAALPGVTLQIRRPETGLQRVGISDDRGIVFFSALPPGAYQLTATLEGFRIYQSALKVNLDAQTDFRFSMKPGAGVVEGRGGAPLLDFGAAVTGFTVSPDDFNAKIPVGREASQIVLLAPATVAGDTAFDGQTPLQNLVSMGGASVAENAYQLNGLNIANFRNGLGSTMVPVEFLQEIEIQTGGHEAKSGASTGGLINMVTKSGSNEFHGSFSLYVEPRDFQEQSPDTYFSPNSDETRETMEANFSLGGAILKDKLFYFGFLRYTDNDVVDLSYSQGTRSEIAEPYWGAKVDWNITPRHHVEATYLSDDVGVDVTIYEYLQPDNWAPGVRPYPSGGRLGHKIGSGVENRGGDNYIAKYTGILSENFLLSAQYGENNFDRTNRSPGDKYPYAFDHRGASYIHLGSWLNWSRGSASDERKAYRIDADWYLAHHALRLGIEGEDKSSHDLTTYTGGIRYSYYDDEDSSTGASVDVRHYLDGGSFSVFSHAAYIQDDWALTPNLNVNLGVRWEKFRNDNSDGKTFIETDNQFAPRIGVVWDPFGEGRSKFYGFVGRYYLEVPSNINIRLAGGVVYDSAYFEWDPAQGYHPDGTPVGYTDCGPLNLDQCGNQGSVGDLLQSTVYSDGEAPGPKEVLSFNFNPMSQDEYILGYEKTVGDNWSIGVRGLWREFNDVLETFAIDQAISNRFGPEYVGYGPFEYRLGNPGRAFDGYVEIDGELQHVHFTAEELGYPDPVRKYGAIEFTFKRRWTDHWMMQGSYTYSHLYGNYEGQVDSDTGQDDAASTDMFDFPGLMENSYGNLPQDRRHNLKIWGAYAFDSGFLFGVNLSYHSGRPIGALGNYPDAENPAYLYGAAAHFNQGQAVARGSVGTTPSIVSLDAMVKYDFQVAGLDMNVRLDVFNLFDDSKATEVDEFADLDFGRANPHYLFDTDFQQPRRVRLGFEMNF